VVRRKLHGRVAFSREWATHTGVSSKNSKANRIETMKGPAESGEIYSVEVEEK
jgi:hypothetical protein